MSVQGLKALLTAALVAALLVVPGQLPPGDGLRLVVRPYVYDLAAWETSHILDKGISALRLLVTGEGPAEEGARQAREYFSLRRRIAEVDARLRASDPNAASADAPGDLASLRRQSDQKRDQAEAALEGQLGVILAQEGLTSELLSQQVLWPPVSFEFTPMPRALVISPRE